MAFSACNISTLRKILNPHFEGGDPITTVARRGYRFSAAVRLRSVGAEISLEPGDSNRILREAGIQ